MSEKKIKVKMRNDEVLDVTLDKFLEIGELKIPLYKSKSESVEIKSLNSFGGEKDDSSSDQR